MLKHIPFLSSLFLLFFSLSCKKDAKIGTPEPTTPPVISQPTPTLTPTVPTTGDKKPEVVFDLKALVNGAALTASGSYTNALADSFTVSKLNYYISNIKFKRDDGFVFSEPESYHLIKHMEGKESFTITNFPEGSYTDIEFIIGVDSTRNVSGSQSGDLGVGLDMFWDWNTGYIFFKMEGSCNTANNPIWKDYAIHVGGFSKPNNCLQSCSFHLGETLIAKNNRKSIVLWHVNADEIFTIPLDLSFDAYGAVSGGKPAKTVSGNYKDMFEIFDIEN
jgi:hypothetical protein